MLKSITLNLNRKRMAAHLQNKISFDVSAEHSLNHSPFLLTYLLKICNQSPLLLTAPTKFKVKKQDQRFLSPTAPALATHSSNKNPPAHMPISNTQLQLHAFLYQLQRTNVTHKLSSKKAAHGSSKGSSDSTEVSDKPARKERKQIKKEHAASSSWFGQNLSPSMQGMPCSQAHC